MLLGALTGAMVAGVHFALEPGSAQRSARSGWSSSRASYGSRGEYDRGDYGRGAFSGGEKSVMGGAGFSW